MIVIFGAGGGLGQALVHHYQQLGEQVLAVSRQAGAAVNNVQWVQVEGYRPEQLLALVEPLTKQPIAGVISTIGTLYSDDFMPEKRLDELVTEHLMHSYYVNAVLPLMLLQWMKPYLPAAQRCFWVQLSAKVGSIADNQLGGWYSYRASKAALNMLLKTAAIELARTHKQLTLAAIHPGTTDTQLSKPFQGRLSADKLYTPQLSAQRIAQVIATLEPHVSGGLWHWDGSRLPY
jgi:NAD(P)-dependent dehydrogenase (short-subunit alcohol dehydrogenase family)